MSEALNEAILDNEEAPEIEEEPTEAIPLDDDTLDENITTEGADAENEDISADEFKKTIAALQIELEAYKAAAAQQEAIARQLAEFSELFPDISVRSIPDQVWDDVKQGNSLAAAYSVYERRITEAARRIESINAKNAQKSAGAVGKNMAQEFFSAEDVRRMSPSEVRANYAKIRRSMEKWN